MTAIHIQVSHAFRNNQKSNMKAFLLKKKKKSIPSQFYWLCKTSFPPVLNYVYISKNLL